MRVAFPLTTASRTASRTALPTSVLLGVLLGVLLAGCSGDASPPSPLLSSASGASAVASAPAAASGAPSGSAPSASSSGVPDPPVLGGSALATPKGYTYSAIAGADGAVPPEVSALAGYFDGYVGRTVIRGGRTVGTVQLLRTKPGVLGSAAAGDKVLQEFLKGFSRATSFDRQSVAGHDVLTAAVPGSPATVAGWRQGQDLILLFAAPSLSPSGFAGSYIRAGKPDAG